METYLMYIYLILALFVILTFRLRSLIFAWLGVVRSFGSAFLVRVKNKTQEYYAVGRVDKTFLYFKGKKRPDNKTPNRMIATNYTWDPVTQKANKPFSFNEAIFRFIGVNCIEVDDEKDCIIFYRQGEYQFVPGTNTELMDENIKTAQAKPSREDGLMDNRKFQIFVLIILVIIVLIAIFTAYQARLIPNVMGGLIDMNNKVTAMYNVIINNVTGLPK